MVLGQSISNLEYFLQNPALNEKKIWLDEKNGFFASLNSNNPQRDRVAEQHWSGHAGSHSLLVNVETSAGLKIETLFCETKNRFNTPSLPDQPNMLWWTFPLYSSAASMQEVKKTDRIQLLLQWSVARWGQVLEKNNLTKTQQYWISSQPRGLLWKSTVSGVWIYGFALDIPTFNTTSISHNMQTLWYGCQTAWQQIHPWFENNEKI